MKKHIYSWLNTDKLYWGAPSAHTRAHIKSKAFLMCNQLMCFIADECIDSIHFSLLSIENSFDEKVSIKLIWNLILKLKHWIHGNDD